MTGFFKLWLLRTAEKACSLAGAVCAFLLGAASKFFHAIRLSDEGLLNVWFIRALVPIDRTYSFEGKNPGAGNPIFVTVHGIWGRNSDLANPESAIATEVKAQWRDSGYYVFKWSGVNRLEHRLSAATRLCEYLEPLMDANSGSDIVLISHSHGGNIAAWSLSKLKHPVTAVVYANTPFIGMPEKEKSSLQIARLVGCSFIFLIPLSLLLAAVCFTHLVRFTLVHFPHLVCFTHFFDSPSTRIKAIGILTAFLLLSVVRFWCLHPKLERLKQRLNDCLSGQHRTNELAIFGTGDVALALSSTLYLLRLVNIGLALLCAVILMFNDGKAAFDYLKTRESTINFFDWGVLWCVPIFTTISLLLVWWHGFSQGILASSGDIFIAPGPAQISSFLPVPWHKRSWSPKIPDLAKHYAYDDPKVRKKMIAWLKDVFAQAAPNR